VKTVFKFVAMTALTGCLDLDAPPLVGDSETADGAGEAGCTSECPRHGLSGDVLVFVNGRFTSADAQYQSNTPQSVDGEYVGSAIHLYDPDAVCDDGGTACRLALLGHADLDAALGDVSVGDGSLKKFGLRELAWSEAHGLWAITYDVANDEWGIAELHVPDWHATDQAIGVDRYAIMPGDPQSPGTDPCYWQEVVSGLGFVGDELLLGVRGLGGVGIDNDGWVFSIDYPMLRDEGWCLYPSDPSQDPQYYACAQVCRPWADFGPALGVAGDITDDASGVAALAMVRAEDDSLMPLDRQEVFRAMPPVGGTPGVPMATGLFAQPVPPGLDLEGLARVDGVLYGIDVAAQVWRLDETSGEVEVYESLAVRFDDGEQALRIRGATTVRIEPG
jgi:hypothetical protein